MALLATNSAKSKCCVQSEGYLLTQGLRKSFKGLDHPLGRIIYLGMENHSEPKICTERVEQTCPKLVGEFGVSVKDDRFREAIESEHSIEKDPSVLWCRHLFCAGAKRTIFHIQSMSTRIAIKPLDSGKSVNGSIVTSAHFLVGISKGCSRPALVDAKPWSLGGDCLLEYGQGLHLCFVCIDTPGRGLILVYNIHLLVFE